MIKKILKVIAWGLGLIVGLGLLWAIVYHSFVRPGNVRSDCDTVARQNATKTGSAYYTFDAYEKRYDFYYTSCLRQKGM